MATFFEQLDGFVGSATGALSSARDRVIAYTGALSDSLDYGDYFGDSQQTNVDTRQNPEMDLTEYDRSNPTALNAGNKTMYIVGGVAAVAVLYLLVRK
tara:strand:- start:3593 stop:3886 length:294 start_codon:yes stop_codon:yes gene_type:complete